MRGLSRRQSLSAYGALSDDEINALAALMRATVLANRFSLTAVA
jgi:hypothetical protein